MNVTPKKAATTICLCLVFFNSLAQVPEIVSDIVPGSNGSGPQFLTTFNGALYFSTVLTSGLWVTDGTDAGTVLAEGMATIGSDFTTGLSVVDGNLFFNTFSAPAWWSTTGGTDNAVQIVDQLQAFGLTQHNSTALGMDVLVFSGRETGVAGSPNQLYRSDGTGTGTVAFGNFISDSGGPTPRGFWTVGSSLLFSASETASGRELYSTDATTGSTSLVKEFFPGTLGGLSDVTGSGGVVLGNVLYIPARSDDPTGTRIWRSDGTSGGTTAVYDETGVGSGTLADYEDPKFLTVFNGSVYFFATDAVSPRLQLWRVAAGDAHPTQITFDPAFVPPSGGFGCFGNINALVVSGTLYFNREDNTAGCELWRSDGTPGGTQRVRDINPGGPDSFPLIMGGAGGELFFAALDVVSGYELWRSDGTEFGTTRVADLNPGPDGSITGNLETAEFAGDLYFVADDGSHGAELFKLALPVPDVPVFSDGFEALGPF